MPEISENNDNDYKCELYATIKEGYSVISRPICGGRGQRESAVFTSVTNSVEIRLVDSKIQQANNDGHFLLKYTG